MLYLQRFILAFIFLALAMWWAAIAFQVTPNGFKFYQIGNPFADILIPLMQFICITFFFLSWMKRVSIKILVISLIVIFLLGLIVK